MIFELSSRWSSNPVWIIRSLSTVRGGRRADPSVAYRAMACSATACRWAISASPCLHVQVPPPCLLAPPPVHARDAGPPLTTSWKAPRRRRVLPPPCQHHPRSGAPESRAWASGAPVRTHRLRQDLNALSVTDTQTDLAGSWETAIMEILIHRNINPLPMVPCAS
uniref:Uncharacterized protein n=1 Tax=Timema monikensis TaxID=170555 RepID=A0A7R9EGU8_9NEOP|nr:unnamed protein product [Timema monikensis]